MSAYEIMLSESQERMLLVAEKDKEKDLHDVFHKWGLDAVTVGYVTDDGLLRVKQQRESKCGNSQHRSGRRRSGLQAAACRRRPAPRFLQSICTPFSTALTTQRSRSFSMARLPAMNF